MDHQDMINMLIQNRGYKSYLEIGMANGKNFEGVECEYKVGVDPDENSRGTTHYITSDEYFEKFNERFDIVLVDGSHEHHQVFRDVVNSLKVLNEGGTIIMHDCNPVEKVREWIFKNGTCWRAFVQAREELDVEAFVVDTDEGCGVLVKSETPNRLTLDCDKVYENLDANREDWLNLKTIDYFKNWAK